MTPIVIALGGNSLIRQNEIGRYEEQLKNVRNACKEIAKASRFFSLAITHGNGPQVGNLEIQMKKAKFIVPEMPLDVEGAMTQAQIGYMIQQSLHEFIPGRRIATVLTQTLVDEYDSAFKKPTKFIGPVYSKKEAQAMQKKGIKLVFQKNKGFRKVVPSPQPKKIIELETIKEMLKRKHIVICCGGGGIPVVKKDGKLAGVEAVIDKDSTSQLLANSINADMLVILTDVEFVKLNFATKHEKNLHKVKASLLGDYLKQGHFEEGSMKPKVNAVLNFLKSGGKKAIITSLNRLMPALNSKTGTIISH
ncbi:carbamate kinase [Candidatus Woesearchaeota archaeon]|nr:carbamate kinase [Candidatus Woesearchaeota archaeon]